LINFGEIENSVSVHQISTIALRIYINTPFIKTIHDPLKDDTHGSTNIN
jgi:hypothetical protein